MKEAQKELAQESEVLWKIFKENYLLIQIAFLKRLSSSIGEDERNYYKKAIKDMGTAYLKAKKYW